jgi:hypothetical protein
VTGERRQSLSMYDNNQNSQKQPATKKLSLEQSSMSEREQSGTKMGTYSGISIYEHYIAIISET